MQLYTDKGEKIACLTLFIYFPAATWQPHTVFGGFFCMSGGWVLLCRKLIMVENMVEFMHLVFTRMPGESYRRRLGSLLCLCDVFRALIISLVC